MVFPILIPSKGRPDSKLFGILKESNVDFSVVVEPQDKDSYSESVGPERVVLLPENDQGLIYSRNFILNYAREKLLSGSWFWMVDDDVKQFYTTQNKRNVKISAKEAFEIAERVLEGNDNIGQAAMEYSQFAWSATKPYTLNSYCDVVVAINIEKTKGLSYRGTAKEDRDFTLQVITSGLNTMRIKPASFSCPANGSNKGGLHEVYQSGKEILSVAELCNRWGSEVCKPITKKNGREDVKINWRQAVKSR